MDKRGVLQRGRQPSWLIRHRAVSGIAHALYAQRGCEHGHDMEDWLKAEALHRRQEEKSRETLVTHVV